MDTLQNQMIMKKKVSKEFMRKAAIMEDKGDKSYLNELNLDQFVDYLVKRYDLLNKFNIK